MWFRVCFLLPLGQFNGGPLMCSISYSYVTRICFEKPPNIINSLFQLTISLKVGFLVFRDILVFRLEVLCMSGSRYVFTYGFGSVPSSVTWEWEHISGVRNNHQPYWNKVRHWHCCLNNTGIFIIGIIPLEITVGKSKLLVTKIYYELSYAFSSFVHTRSLMCITMINRVLFL